MASSFVVASPNSESDFPILLGDSLLNGARRSLPTAHRTLVQPRRKAMSFRSANNNGLSLPPSSCCCSSQIRHTRESQTRRRRTVRVQPYVMKAELLFESAEKESQTTNWSPGNGLDSCASTASPYNSQDDTLLGPPPTIPSIFSGSGEHKVSNQSPPHALMLRRFLERSNTDGIIPEHTRRQLLSSLDFVPTKNSVSQPSHDFAASLSGQSLWDTQTTLLPIQKRSALSSSETTLASGGKNTSPPSEESFQGGDDLIPSFVAPPQQQERLSLIKRLAEAGLPYRPRPVPSLPPLRHTPQQAQVFVNPSLLDFNVIHRRDRTTSNERQLSPYTTPSIEVRSQLSTSEIEAGSGSTLDMDDLPDATNILGHPIQVRVLDLYEAPLTSLHSLEAPKETNKLSHLILTWTTSPAYHVEVAGTFTDPPWKERHELYWCKESRCHWIDLHEICPRLCGIQQFKFIVDGVWKCDPSYPICDDGSSFHHLNNVMVIFPHRLRVRLSHQRLLRRHSLSNSYTAAADPSTIRNASRVLQRRTPPGKADLLATTDSSHTNPIITKPPLADSLFDIFADADSTLGCPSPETLMLPSIHNNDACDHPPPTPISTNPSDLQSTDQDRSDQSTEGGGGGGGGGLLNSSLLRIPSWACRTLLDCSCVSAHTTPAALSKNTSRALLESRWRQAADSTVLTPGNDGSDPGETSPTRHKSPIQETNMAWYHIGRQVTSPVEPTYSLEAPSTQASTWRERRLLPVPRMPKPPVISGSGSADSQACRPLMISTCQDITPTARDYVGGDNRRVNDKNTKRHRKRRRRHDSRTLQGSSLSEGPLVRCLSHHGGRQMEPKSPLDGSETILTDWPSWVTEHLHSPEVLLELLLPSNVMKMQAENLQLFPGWSMTPHPEKTSSGGADAFYISSDCCCLALADGVGEWDDLGFSPRSFADELMQGVKSVWEKKSHPIHSLFGRLRPSAIARELMKLACNNPTSYGSATCCIVIFDAMRQQLGICNLGDSGVSIMRRGKKYQMVEEFKTPELCHFFNCPYQVSHSPPPQVLAKVFGMTHLENGKGFVLPSEDLPKHAQCFDFTTEEGDLLILASDGLWDNLWDFEIQGLCNLALAPFEALILHDENLETGADEVARAVLEAASYRSRDVTARTPFAKSYTTECGIPAFTGGKWDDITVVAAWVGRKASSTLSRRTETSPPCFLSSAATDEGTTCSASGDRAIITNRSSQQAARKTAMSFMFDDLYVAPARFPYSALSEGHSDDIDTDSEFMKEVSITRNCDDSASKLSSSPRSTMPRNFQHRKHHRGRTLQSDLTCSTSRGGVTSRASRNYVPSKRLGSARGVHPTLVSPAHASELDSQAICNTPSRGGSESHKRRHLKRTKEQLAALYPAGAKYGEC